eukprot:612838_1
MNALWSVDHNLICVYDVIERDYTLDIWTCDVGKQYMIGTDGMSHTHTFRMMIERDYILHDVIWICDVRQWTYMKQILWFKRDVILMHPMDAHHIGPFDYQEKANKAIKHIFCTDIK